MTLDEEKVLKKLKNKHTKESIILLDYIDSLEKDLKMRKKEIEIMAEDIFKLSNKKLSVKDLIYCYDCKALSIVFTNGEL